MLRPDLVIIQKSATALMDRLSALGIRYAIVTIGSLADVHSMIRDVARALSLPERGDKLNGEIRSRLDEVRVEASGKPRPTVLIVVGRTPGLLTNLSAAGPGTYLGELLEIAGGRNALPATGISYPHIALETVVRMNPDVILDLSIMGGTAGDPIQQEARLHQPWLTHRELTAVRNGAIYGLTSEALVTPGPRVVDAAEMIRAKIRRDVQQ